MIGSFRDCIFDRSLKVSKRIKRKLGFGLWALGYDPNSLLTLTSFEEQEK